MPFFKQPRTLAFLFLKSATTCHLDSNETSNSKLKSYLCNRVETKAIEAAAPAQQLLRSCYRDEAPFFRTPFPLYV